jgi:hypothetical protein
VFPFVGKVVGISGEQCADMSSGRMPYHMDPRGIAVPLDDVIRNPGKSLRPVFDEYWKAHLGILSVLGDDDNKALLYKCLSCSP